MTIEYMEKIAKKQCPICGSRLVGRKSSSNEVFLGCSNFSHTGCNYTISIDDLIITSIYYYKHKQQVD